MLTMKKTESRTVSDNPQSERNLNQNHINRNNNIDMEIGSQKISSSKSLSYMNSSKWSNNQIIPDSLRKSLILKNQTQQKDTSKQSSQVGFLQRIFHQCFALQKYCSICGNRDNQDSFVSVFDCGHDLCQNCAESYILYKIKVLEEIICPYQSCNSIMDKKSDFYKRMSQGQKKECERIHKFYVDHNSAQVRLCQKKGCEGVVEADSGNKLKCSRCQTIYCQKCVMVEHSDSCEQNLMNFYSKELNLGKNHEEQKISSLKQVNSQKMKKGNNQEQQRRQTNPELTEALEVIYTTAIQQSPKVIVTPPIVSNVKNTENQVQKNDQNPKYISSQRHNSLRGYDSAEDIRKDQNFRNKSREYHRRQDLIKCSGCGKQCWNCLIFFLMEMIALPVQILVLLIILLCLIFAAIFVFPVRYIRIFWNNKKRCIAITWIILYPITIIFAIGHSIGKGWGDTAIVFLNRVMIQPFNNCLGKCLGPCFKQ